MALLAQTTLPSSLARNPPFVSNAQCTLIGTERYAQVAPLEAPSQTTIVFDYLLFMCLS